MRFDSLQEHAREALCLGPEWIAFFREVVAGSVFRCVLAVPRTIAKGPHKGKRTFKGLPTREFACSIVEHRKWYAGYCAARGWCPKCAGRGEVLARWNKDDGTTTRKCAECEGSGKRNG